MTIYFWGSYENTNRSIIRHYSTGHTRVVRVDTLRIVNKKLTKSLQGEPCIICGYPGTAHHVTSKGAGGSDIPDNLMQLCDNHHTLAGDSVHRKGLYEFAKMYDQVTQWLIDHNWEFNELYKKWTRDS